MSFSSFAHAEVPSAKQFNISSGNYNALYPDFADQVLLFGETGNALLTGAAIVSKPPAKGDLDADGDRLYPAREDGVTLTTQGLSMFRDAEKLYRENEAIRRVERIGLLSCIIAHLSPVSKVALSTLSGNRYEQAKLACDPVAVWKLVLETHMFGSARTKQRQFSELVAVKQSGSHEDYLNEIRVRSRLVVAAFEDKDKAGFIKIDVLLKIIYLNGLDQVYFERVIARIQESMPNCSLEEAMVTAQQYALEHGPASSVSATSFVGKAFVGEALSPPARPKLGAFVPGSEFCPHCWSKNFKKKHALADCFWASRQTRKAYVAAALDPSVSVSTSSIVLPAASAALPVVVSGSGSTAVSDQSVVEAYERGVYMAARQRLGLNLSSFMAPYAYVSAVFFGSTFFYDCCCSVSIVNKKEFLLDSVLLTKPFRIGGIADGVTITHRGKLPVGLLPVGLNDAFYSADARSSLISLGFIHRNGGHYGSEDKDTLLVRDQLRNVLDRSIMCDNNLYPVTLDRLRAAYPNIPVDVPPAAFLSTVSTHVSASAGCDSSGRNSLSSEAPSALTRTNILRNCLKLPALDVGFSSVLAVDPCVDSRVNPTKQEVAVSLFRDLSASVNVPACMSMLAGDLMVVPRGVNDDVAIAARGCASALLALSDVELVHRYERDAELAHAISIPSQDAVAFSCGAAGPVAYGAWQDGVQHFSAEQRDRCDRAEKLHCMAHMSDDVVCEALAIGEFRWANITPHDVRINRKLRGACPHCLASKLKNKSMPSSLTPPATSVGESICFDLKALLSKSPGGNLNSLRSVDEFTGDSQVNPSVSKTSLHIFNALMFLVHTRYNAFGHRVQRMVADSEPALIPVIPMLGMHGIVLTQCPPGQHQQRMERTIGFLDDRKVALFDELAFYVPSTYDIFGDKWISDLSNEVPNVHSRPSTPDILVTGARRTPHYSIPDLKFGDVCMVQQFPIKRAVEAKANGVPVKNVPDAEIGVCLGYSPEVPGAYIFVLANGQVVPRRVVGQCQVHPFDWRRKKVYKAELALPSVEPRRMGHALVQQPEPTSVLLDSDNSVLSVAQLPVTQLPISHFESNLPAAPLPSSVATLLSASDVVEPFIESIEPVVNENVFESAVMIDEVASVPTSAESPGVPFSVPSFSSVLSSPVRATSRAARSISKPIGFWSKQPVAKQAVVDDEWVVPNRTVKRAVAQAAYLSAVLLNSPVLTSASTMLMSASAPTVMPSLVCSVPSARTILPPSVVSDALTLDERKLLQDIIDDNCAYVALADVANSSWYDVSTADDLSLEECCDYMKSPLAYAARVSSDQLCPVPIIKCKEMGLYRAFKAVSMDRLVSATKEHIFKLQKLGCLGEKVFRDVELPSRALVIGAQVLYKLKDDDRFTCRVAGRGDTLPVDPTVVNFAAVASDGDKSFALAAMQAHCSIRGEKLRISDADVHDAFSQIKRPLGSPALFIRFPKNLPHALAGLCLEVKGALPGLTESNRLFDLELARVLIQEAGFSNDICSPRTFVKFDARDSGLKCIINTHVDDMRILDNSLSLAQDAVVALEKRFGPMRSNSPSLTFTGVECKQFSNGAVMQSQDRYIVRLAQSVGVAHMDPVDMPAHEDFFKPSLYEACTLIDPVKYQSLTGSLVQVKTRDDIKHFVSHLCSRNAEPNEGDYAKAIHLLRYLHSSSEIGRVFLSDSLQLCCWADAAYANASEGRSVGAHFLSVGPNNAPFVSVVKFLSVATSPTDAEYMNTTPAAKLIMHFRFLSEFLGWPQSSVPMYLDSQTAINLAEAPQISKKSLHLEAKHHYIRDCHVNGFISLCHVPAARQRANIMTKFLRKLSFQLERGILLNLAALSVRRT